MPRSLEVTIPEAMAIMLHLRATLGDMGVTAFIEKTVALPSPCHALTETEIVFFAGVGVCAAPADWVECLPAVTCPCCNAPHADTPHTRIYFIS